MFPKSSKIQEYQNHYSKSTKIYQNLSKSIKIDEKHKKSQKNTKSKGKRPKAKVSSHNACRFGYPFFLSPSDDDAMLEIPNPTPSVHQTPDYYYCCYCCFWFCADQKEKKHDLTKFPSKIKTQRQVKSQHCTFSPKPPKIQEYQNNHQKSTKIH